MGLAYPLCTCGNTESVFATLIALIPAVSCASAPYLARRLHHADRALRAA